MLTDERTHDIFDRLKKFSTADEVEVIIAGGKHALTRFANNTIHQNVAEENYMVSVRTVFAGKTARATTNKSDDASLRRAVQASESIARVQQPDPDLLPVTAPGECAASSAEAAPPRYFEQTAALGPAERAAAVEKIVATAKKHNLTTAGIFSSSASMEAVLNSRGLAQYFSQTSSEISVTMLAADSSGWQKSNSPNVQNVNPVALADTAARKALASAQPRELPPGKYTVILEPAAVLDLIGFMFWDWGGQAVLDARSFLMNRIGTRLFGEKVNIWDDAYHALQSGPPFDGEGMRRKRVQLVEDGVVKNLVFARTTAEKVKRSQFAAHAGNIQPTGHGLPLPNEIGEIPVNIVVPSPANAKTLDEMIAATERGILITRLWYIREVDPYEKILTGMTRDGTFYVEAGKPRYGLRNFRFNQSLIDMLAQVEDMGPAVRASGEESFDMVVPAMKVRDFNFTEVTRF
jgi:predicted Zn-dependent protease